MPRILVLDDHPMICNALAERIQQLIPSAQVEQTKTLTEAKVALTIHPYDLAIADIMLGKESGLALTHLKQGPPVIIYSMLAPAHFAEHAPGERFIGSVNKADEPTKLDQMILTHFNEAPSPTEQSIRENSELSSREKEVLKHFLAGEGPTAIAKHMGITYSAVQSYKLRLFAKLGIKNLRDLLRLAAQKKWF